ncbi:hypothetical protein SEA_PAULODIABOLI_307 [Microbacterium phage PauloDiaboli]|nr:hypothetical protein SEA_PAULODIABOLI_307 [Microbacterium phage PauloDiaboli]QWY84114.1 hypothetical protein SEA_A3WALLY_307 [Microbacterium phage A3Wally]
MTIAFMQAYWSTFIPMFFGSGMGVLVVLIELDGYRRVFWARIVFPIFGVAVLACLVGIWLPVFVPGLY